jgi:DNA-binding transcriptional LysR family regulator
MDLVQLEHFLAVADERTFTRAAERVFRTQPALSQSIKNLKRSWEPVSSCATTVMFR